MEVEARVVIHLRLGGLEVVAAEVYLIALSQLA